MNLPPPDEIASYLKNPLLYRNFSLEEKINYYAYADDPIGFCTNILKYEYTDDIKAMMESVKDNVITIAKSGNSVGKTHGAASVAIWAYKTHPASCVYTCAAPPENNLKRILWGEIETIMMRNKEMFAEDKMGNMLIQRGPKSFIAGLTIPQSGSEAQKIAKFSGKHAPWILFIVDEGDGVPEEIYKGIESNMSGENVRLLIMFNPRDAIGPVYEKEKFSSVVNLSVFNHPNVVQGKNIIPGAIDRATTVRRINQWARKLTEDEEKTSNCFELPEFLIGEIGHDQNNKPFAPLEKGFYEIEDPALSFMVLGEYPVLSSTQLISSEWIDKARARYDLYVAKNGKKPPEGTRAIMGLDVAEFGGDKNCCIKRYGNFVGDPKKWSGVDTAKTAERATDIYKEKDDVEYINIDAIGYGSSIAPTMRKNKCNAYGVKTSEAPTTRAEQGEFFNLRAQLAWMCREWLKNDAAMLPYNPQLIEELKKIRYHYKKGKILIMEKDELRKILKRSPDDSDTLFLTFAPRRRPGIAIG